METVYSIIERVIPTITPKSIPTTWIAVKVRRRTAYLERERIYIERVR